jgi:hypothetical protein
LDHWQEDLSQALGSDPSQKTFYDLEQHFWKRDGATGFLGSQGKLCPRDGRLGCALVDAVEPRFRGRATHYVSWCWAYQVSNKQGALERWCRDNSIDPDTTFLWICFWCNNQRKILIENRGCGSDNLAQTFRSKLTGIGQVVIVFEDYRDPLYLSRIWTVFEVFVASKLKGVTITMTMPLGQDTILRGDTVENLQRNVARLDAEYAKAYCKADEERIKDEIRRSPGSFAGVNRTVKRLLAGLLSAALNKIMLAEVDMTSEMSVATN